MEQFNEERLKEFTKRTLEEYEGNYEIDKFTIQSKLQENETDGTFTKIGLRPLLDRNVFTTQTGTTFISPQLMGLGHSISLGELKYFVTTIINDNRPETIRIRKSTFRPARLLNEINHLRGEIFLFMDLNDEIDFSANRHWRGCFTHDLQGTRLFNQSYPVYVTIGNILRNKIILFDKISSVWLKVLFQNDRLNKKIPLNISIGTGRNNEKVDVLAYSLIKLYIMDPTKIKIIELV